MLGEFVKCGLCVVQFNFGFARRVAVLVGELTALEFLDEMQHPRFAREFKIKFIISVENVNQIRACHLREAR